MIALLKGPDTQYKTMLMNDYKQLSRPRIDFQCQDKSSFLQINVRECVEVHLLGCMLFVKTETLYENNISFS